MLALIFSGCLLPRIVRKPEGSDAALMLDAVGQDVAIEDGPVDTTTVAIPDALACAPGQTRCGGACVDLMTSTANCGACDRECNPGVGDQNTCSGGFCTSAPNCRAGYARIGTQCFPSRCGGAGQPCLSSMMCPATACPIAVHSITDSELAVTGSSCTRANAYDVRQIDACSQAAESLCVRRGYLTGWGPIKLETTPENQLHFVCVSDLAVRSAPRVTTSPGSDCDGQSPFSAGCMDRLSAICERTGDVGMGPVRFDVMTREVSGVCLRPEHLRRVLHPAMSLPQDCILAGPRRSNNCLQWTHAQCQIASPFALSGTRTVQNSGGSQAEWGYECLFNP